MLEEKSFVFPINFKVFSQPMVDAAHERYENNKRKKKKQQIKKSNPLQVNKADDHSDLVSNLKNVSIYISTKTRLPSSDNFEKHINGLDNLNFAFSPDNFLELAAKKKIPLIQKVYISLKYGDLDEENGASNENQEIDFFMQLTYSLKLTHK